MAYDYDELYRKTPQALGAANVEVAAFFENLSAPLRVLDVGCGQGRDAIPIARQGHEVVGVDLSPAGISDLNAAATADGLNATGHVADIRFFEPEGTFDILLVDRTLHMLASDERNIVLAQLLDTVRSDGWLLLLDEKSNMSGFVQALAEHPAKWDIVRQKGGLLFSQRVS